MAKKLFVFGLDAAPPKLLFEDFRDKLPNFSKLIDKSIYGRMRSCDPPITVPAWMVMMTGKEPGSLGLYGFRHRKGYSYREFTIPSSKVIRDRKVWDYLGYSGLKSFVMGVPPTYPPYRIEGWMVSGFLTPSSKSRYTYPFHLKDEISDLVGDYVFDVVFRREDRESVLDELFEMTRQHRDVVLNMIRTKPWDLFIYMEIGLDRVQHAFWKYMDSSHPRYTHHDRLSRAILDYYILLDDILGNVLSYLDDDAALMIVSDHGAKMMKGAFAINDWLIEKGYLSIKGDVEPGSGLSDLDIDWENTVAWGWGGYYARIFFNLKGRESKGVLDEEEFSKVRDELAKDIMDISGPDGERWRNHVYFPESLYRVVNGNPPDMMVYFDDLYWRSAGTLGYEDYYLPENDTGPDDAVHDYDGVYVFYDPERKRHGEIECSIYDIAPTILKFFDLDWVGDFKGEPIL